MLSVNSNFGASVALQSLNSTNKELNEVQNRISTGYKVASARDNGAVYAIAEGQRARVSSVAAVKDGIDRASSTVDVALAAGKSVGEILQKLKAKAVAAQADDLTSDQRAALQVDFENLRSQIDTIANAAQFNGANLALGSDSLNVLISDLGGSVAATTDGNQTAVMTTPLSGSALVNDLASTSDGDVVSFALTGAGGSTLTIGVELTAGMTIDGFIEAVNSQAGGKISASYDDTTGQITYLINDTQFDDLVVGGDATAEIGSTTTTTTVSSAGSNTFQVTGFDFSLTGSILSSLASSDISVSTAAATTASNAIDTAINSLNQALATMGSQAAALDIQNDFLSSLSDVIEQGIGNLVDADLAKESARLQSLQIKQQLGAQALSIANQAPSLILSFFR